MRLLIVCCVTESQVYAPVLRPLTVETQMYSTTARVCVEFVRLQLHQQHLQQQQQPQHAHQQRALTEVWYLKQTFD